MSPKDVCGAMPKKVDGALMIGAPLVAAGIIAARQARRSTAIGLRLMGWRKVAGASPSNTKKGGM